MAPYPTASQIASIFQSIGPNGGNFINHVDANANLKVMGHEHSTKADHSSPQKVADEFFGQFDFVDWDTINIDVLHVIGGGDSPWASVELSSKGKSKKGAYLETFQLVRLID